MADLEFNLNRWEDLADQLLKEDRSEPTKTDIQKDVTNIYHLLEEKLKEEEGKFKDDIYTEEEAIEKLKQRIQDSQSKSVADGESLLHDAVTLYHRIKQQEWSEVYEIMTHLTKDSETVICARLISILKECYNQCEQQIQTIGEEIKQEIASPGLPHQSNGAKQKVPKKKGKGREPDELSSIAEEFLKKTGPSIFPHHKQTLLERITTSKVYKSVPLTVIKDKEAEKPLKST